MGMSLNKDGFLYVKNFAVIEKETQKIKNAANNLVGIAQKYKRDFNKNVTNSWGGQDTRVFEEALDKHIAELKRIQAACDNLAKVAKENADYERQAVNGGFRVGF